MFTDIIGYQGLAQASETRASELLRTKRDILFQVSAEHGGQGSKPSPDRDTPLGLKGWLRGAGLKEKPGGTNSYSILIFDNPVNAVRCAVEFQKRVRDHNRTVPKDKELQAGVGIALGQFELRGEEVFGEPLGLVSRIWDLAGPSGVCVTEQVYDQVKNRSDISATSLGRRSLKNAEPTVEVYSVVLPWEDRVFTKLTPPVLDPKRVAVLPLVSLSPDPNDEYFADGTTEEMISTLSNISNLTVISRTSVMQYKGVKKNLADIGRELKAGTMLEGSIRKAGNRVRITVQLLDAVEDKHLWAQSYDRELQDVFSVQSDIATSVAEALKVKLLASDASQIQKKPTENTEAYLQFLKGRQLWNKRTEEAVNKAIEYFILAIEHDPGFALAYVALADCYVVLNDKPWAPPDTVEKMTSAVLKALDLDQTLPEAHSTYAMVLSNNWNWDASEAQFKKAISLNPNYATAHHWYSFLLTTEGRLEEALGEAKRALELDPLAPVMSYNVSRVLHALERWDDAIEYLKRSLAIDPNFPYALFGMMVAYSMKKNFDEVAYWWGRLHEGDDPNAPKAGSMVELAIIQAAEGKRDAAHKSLDSAMKMQGSERVQAGDLAYFYALLRDEDRALQWLERALTKREPGAVSFIKWEPVFRDLRSTPRFQEILKRMGLDKY